MKSKFVFLLLITALLITAPAAAQQPKKVPRIGYLSGDPATESARSEGIRLALRELGYIEGQNIAIEYRYGGGEARSLPELAAELVRLKVDIIVAQEGLGCPETAKNATKTIPIVMVGAWGRSRRGRPGRKSCPSRRQRHRRHKPFRRTRREAAGAVQRSRSQSCPCRGSLRTGQSARCTRGERDSPSRGACAEVDYSALGGTDGGRFR